jgi:hypothetical protein
MEGRRMAALAERGRPAYFFLSFLSFFLSFFLWQT